MRESKLGKSFKLGVDVSNEKEFVPNTWKNPQGSNNFFENNLDKLRSVIYHEFAHQVHQTKNYKEVTEKGGMFAQAPIEKALANPTISRGVKGSSATDILMKMYMNGLQKTLVCITWAGKN